MSYVAPRRRHGTGAFRRRIHGHRFLTGLPLPGNIIPFSRVDPLAEAALDGLRFQCGGPGGGERHMVTSGTLPAGGHFTIGLSSSAPQNLGDLLI